MAPDACGHSGRPRPARRRGCTSTSSIPGRLKRVCPKTRLRPWCKRATVIFGWAHKTAWHASMGSGCAVHSAKSPAIHNRRIVQLLEDRQGALWIGTEDAGLVRLDRRRFTPFSAPHQGTAYNYARALCEDAEGGLWMATCENQLLRWSEGVFSVPSAHWGLAGTVVSAVAGDLAGQVWVGTDQELAVRRNGVIRACGAEARKKGFASSSWPPVAPAVAGSWPTDACGGSRPANGRRTSGLTPGPIGRFMVCTRTASDECGWRQWATACFATAPTARCYG